VEGGYVESEPTREVWGGAPSRVQGNALGDGQGQSGPLELTL